MKLRTAGFAALWLAGSALWAQSLRAGAAQVRITPSGPVPLAGYFRERVSTGVHDDLWAKAVVLESGGRRAALVVCDVLEIPGEVSAEARRRIEAGTGIRPELVMISATHTHVAPEVVGGFARGLPEKIAEAVRLAAEQMEPARVSWSQGEAPSLVFHRRFFMRDGSVVCNPGKRNPAIVRPAGPVDPRVSVVTIDGASGKPIATLVNYALHLDTVGGTEITADYPFTLGRLLSGARGGGLVLFTIGCAGNINHFDVTDASPQRGHAEAARIGTVLAGEAVKAMARLQPAAGDGLRGTLRKIPLPAVPHSPEELAWSRSVLERAAKGDKIPFLELVKAHRIARIEAHGASAWQAEVQAIALGGELAWVALPGEVFVELGLDLRRASPFRHTIAVALANQSLGYFPHLAAWPQGHYEVVTARCGRGSGEALVEAALELLKELKSP